MPGLCLIISGAAKASPKEHHLFAHSYNFYNLRGLKRACGGALCVGKLSFHLKHLDLSHPVTLPLTK